MKKQIILLTLTSLFLVTGCGAEKEKTEPIKVEPDVPKIVTKTIKCVSPTSDEGEVTNYTIVTEDEVPVSLEVVAIDFSTVESRATILEKSLNTIYTNSSKAYGGITFSIVREGLKNTSTINYDFKTMNTALLKEENPEDVEQFDGDTPNLLFIKGLYLVGDATCD